MPDDVADEVKLSRLGRNVQLRVDSVDETARTVEVVWTTGAAVRRYMPGLGRVLEELDVSPEAIRLDRLNNGAPFLNTHSDWSLNDVIGVVERAWIEDGEGRALIRLSERDDVEPIWRDIKGGIIRNVSVGYQVHRYEVIESDDDGCTRVIARDWEPMEISAVPIGADDKAGFRAADGQIENPCIIERAEPAQSHEETPMSTKAIEKTGDAPKDDVTRAQPVNPPVNTPAPVDTEALARTARDEERKRASEIRTIGRKLKLDDAAIDAQIADGNTVDQARAAFIDLLADQDDKAPQTRARISGHDEVDVRRGLAINALEHRMAPSGVALEDGARQFRGMNLLEIGKDLLAQRGENVRGLSRSELAAKILRSSHTTSDFPYILANVASKRLQKAYESAPQTFRPIVNEVTLPDFKTTSVVALSDAPAFVQKLEGAEYTYGTFGESREQYALATYGRAIRFTEEMLINDDLRAFDRMVTMFGRSAANFESDLVWAIITANAAMADTVALFDAAHGNLVTAGAITIDNLGKAKAAMRKQTSLAPSADESGSLLNLEPRYLAVPAELETVALQYTRSMTIANDPAYDNVHAGLTPIIEPRLASLSGGSADDWYLFADPGDVDTIDFASLEGEQGPVIQQVEDFDTDAIKLKARLRRAAKAIDYRGMVKNPGS
ncbi:MAG: hypothetical protein ACJA0Y_000183 [Maricaulis maris]|jgi:hypothetical protein